MQEAAKKKPTSIVITGSKQGITNPPGSAAYNASKAAVKTLAEHLSFDLKDTKTSVHLLVPGWTFTGMVSHQSKNLCVHHDYDDADAALPLDWRWPDQGKAGWGLGARAGRRIPFSKDDQE